MNKHFTVNEYEYWTDEDVEPDVRKLWHYCRRILFSDWSIDANTVF